MKVIHEGEGTGPANPLDALAGRIEGDQAADTPTDPDEAAKLAVAQAQFNKMLEGLGVFTGKALRAVRSRISKSLPEILEHWTDADLAAVAEAMPPVAAKWLGKLGPLLGDYPEECMLVLAAAPLVAGYVGAVSDHADKGDTHRIAGPAPLPIDNGPTPAPAGTPVHFVG